MLRDAAPEDADAAIAALFAAYAEAMDDADAEAVTDLFVWPTTIWQFGTGHVFEDAEALQENVEALIDVFDEAGIISTEPAVEAIRTAGGAGFASVRWRQHDSDGALLHEFVCQYLLVHHAEAWKIATIVNGTAEE
jgi:ketosteroid isomerase-like protein